MEEVLRLAELEEQGGTITNGMKGTKAVAEAGEPRRNGNGEVADGELEDGEVDEDGDVNIGPGGDTGGGASERKIIGPQLLPAPSTAADKDRPGKEKASKTQASETETSAQTTDAIGPGKNAIPLLIEKFEVELSCAL